VRNGSAGWNFETHPGRLPRSLRRGESSHAEITRANQRRPIARRNSRYPSLSSELKDIDGTSCFIASSTLEGVMSNTLAKATLVRDLGFDHFDARANPDLVLFDGRLFLFAGVVLLYAASRAAIFERPQFALVEDVFRSKGPVSLFSVLFGACFCLAGTNSLADVFHAIIFVRLRGERRDRQIDCVVSFRRIVVLPPPDASLPSSRPRPKPCCRRPDRPTN
jgi:hypothetical protein